MLLILGLVVASAATSVAQPATTPGDEPSAGRNENGDPTFRDYRGRPGRDTIFEGLEENVSLRSQGAKVFAVPGGGAHFLQLFNTPVHFQDANGDWQEIDTSLVRTAGGFRNGANSFDVFLPARLSAADPVQVGVGGGSLSIAMAGVSPSVGEPENDAVTYPELRDGVSAEYALTDSGYKENVFLASPDAPSSFTYDIRARGLTLGQEADGRITVRTAEGQVGLFPPLFVAEAPREDGSPGEASYDAVAATLAATGPGHYELQVAIDRAWLEAQGRRYPVRLDPSFVASDCRVTGTSCSGAGNGVPLLKDMYRTIPPSSSGSAYNIAGDAQLYAGGDYGTESSTSMTYMTFDVRQEIRKVGDMIYDARFDLDNYSATGGIPYTSPTFRLQRITADWDQWSGVEPQVDESKVWSLYDPCSDGDCGAGWSLSDPNR
ncbi:MAG TPA: hypothetical protein VHJ76_05120 [Actinomycetota bacterium]|nr:hypothetical protein [Actinomycetota bacterium]